MFDKAQEEQMALAEKKRVVEEDKAKILEVRWWPETGPRRLGLAAGSGNDTIMCQTQLRISACRCTPPWATTEQGAAAGL